MDDKQEEQSRNQSQHVKKPAICDEELNHEENEEGYKWNVTIFFANLEILCQ